MILLYILAAYILVGLLTACFIAAWAEFCPTCPVDEIEELTGFAILWPMFWLIFVRYCYRYLRWPSWVYRVRAAFA